jgi:hypothetical protein
MADGRNPTGPVCPFSPGRCPFLALPCCRRSLTSSPVGGGGSRALFSFRGQKIIIIVIIIIIVVYPETHMSSSGRAPLLSGRVSPRLLSLENRSELFPPGATSLYDPSPYGSLCMSSRECRLGRIVSFGLGRVFPERVDGRPTLAFRTGFWPRGCQAERGPSWQKTSRCSIGLEGKE